jgi:hypothetical protein
MTDSLTHFIAGERVSADTPNSSINPSNTDDVVARFPAGGKDEVDAAAKAARAAFPGWADASPEVRSDLLDKVGATIMAGARARPTAGARGRQDGRRGHRRSHARGADLQIFRGRGASPPRLRR